MVFKASHFSVGGPVSLWYTSYAIVTWHFLSLQKLFDKIEWKTRSSKVSSSRNPVTKRALFFINNDPVILVFILIVSTPDCSIRDITFSMEHEWLSGRHHMKILMNDTLWILFPWWIWRYHGDYKSEIKIFERQRVSHSCLYNIYLKIDHEI